MSKSLDTVLTGDCLDRLSALEEGCVDLAFADPPFNIGYDYDAYDDRRADADYLQWSRDWIRAVHRVLRPNGAFWLAIGDEYAAELKVAATREIGFICRSWVVWYYTFGVHCRSKFTRSHAHLFYFLKPAPTPSVTTKGRRGRPRKSAKASTAGNAAARLCGATPAIDVRPPTFNVHAIRVPSARQLVYGDKRANPSGRVPDDTWMIPPVSGEADGKTEGGADHHDRRHVPASSLASFILRPQDLDGGFAADSDTWYFPRVCGTFKEREGFHGCQMPEQLLGRIIRACSNEGDVVLDPFAGSGTTLAVARKLARRYLGVEFSPDYVKQIKKRLAAARVGQPLDGFEDPLTSAPDTRSGVVRTADGKRVKRNGTASARTHGCRENEAVLFE